MNTQNRICPHCKFYLLSLKIAKNIGHDEKTGLCHACYSKIEKKNSNGISYLISQNKNE